MIQLVLEAREYPDPHKVHWLKFAAHVIQLLTLQPSTFPVPVLAPYQLGMSGEFVGLWQMFPFKYH